MLGFLRALVAFAALGLWQTASAETADIQVAQMMSLTGAGSTMPTKVISGGGYTGPGDLIASGWFFYVGMRAFSAAYAASAGAAFDFACTGGSPASGTVHVQSSGDLSSSDVTSMNSGCTGHTITISKLYDQTGGGHNFNQATAANQPLLIANCKVSGKFCWESNATSMQMPITTAVTQALPLAIVMYGNKINSGGAITSMVGDTAGFNGLYDASAGSFRLLCGGVPKGGDVTVTVNTWHAWTENCDTATTNCGSTVSCYSLDGAAFVGWSGGSSGWGSDTVAVPASGGSSVRDMDIAEAGALTAVLTVTQASNLSTNQATYW